MALDVRRGRPAVAPGGPGATASASDWIVPAGLALALVLVSAQVVTQLIDFGVYGLRIAALNSNLHGSVFGVASVAAQAAAAMAAAVAAAWTSRRAIWAVT